MYAWVELEMNEESRAKHTRADIRFFAEHPFPSLSLVRWKCYLLYNIPEAQINSHGNISVRLPSTN